MISTFFKAEINTTQLQSLASFVGPQGIYSEIIRNDKENKGTKIVFLQKAIEENPYIFVRYLDCLFDVFETIEGKENNLELIRCLKAINDLCFNTDIKFGEFDIRPALDHYFGKFGEIHPNLFQAKIRSIIQEDIDTLENSEKEEKIKKEKEAAYLLFDRKYNQPNTTWREMLDLPMAFRTLQANDSMEKPKFNRRQLNAIRYLIANEGLSLDDPRFEYSPESVFIPYFCLEGLGIPLAEGLKYSKKELLFFHTVKPLILRNLLTVAEVKNFSILEKKLFKSVHSKEQDESWQRNFQNRQYKKLDMVHVYNEFQKLRQQPHQEAKEECVIPCGQLVTGVSKTITNSTIMLDYCVNDNVTARKALARICEQVGLESNSMLRQRSLEIITEYARNRPSFIRNLQIIAELTKRQIAQSDTDKESIQLINQIVNEILGSVGISFLESKTKC